MKTPFIITTIILVVLAIVFLRPSQETQSGAMPSSPLTASVVLEPRTSATAVGDTVLVDVVARGVTDVSGVQFDVNYDSTKLAFVQADEGTFLSQQGADKTVLADIMDTSAPGAVHDVIIVKLGSPGSSGSGTVATMQFRALASGSAPVDITSLNLASSEGKPIAVPVRGTRVIVN